MITYKELAMKTTFLSAKPLALFLKATALTVVSTSLAFGQIVTPEQKTWPRLPTVPATTLSSSLTSESPAASSSPLAGTSDPQKRNWNGPRYTYTLEELGARFPFNLRGTEGSDSVLFNIRADEAVTQAEVDLIYSYSPTLISDMSHINVLVNDVVVTTLPVPRENAGKLLRQTIEIPAHLITDFNQLRFQLIGHYTLECEDPLHTSLWANISNKSTLSLDVTHIALPNDLSILPLPFFDRRDSRRLTLPVVFANDKSDAVFESAGMIASWFGSLAAHRGARFPAHLDGNYPEKGNALVLMKSDANAALPAVLGPTIAVTANPNDPSGKLLWVMGRNAEEIRQAAQALVTGSATLTGQAITVERVEKLSPRLPYDAPKWIPTDRPVMFGELVPEKNLNVSGYQGAPARLDLRLPPDLFGWRGKPVPVNLNYRYTVQPGQVDSSLLVSTNQQFTRSFPLSSVDQIKERSQANVVEAGELLPVRAKMTIPLDQLREQSQLEFQFRFDYVKEGFCRDIIIDNVRGRIDPDSTLDFSSYPHFMLLPDLAAFGNSGFPFTRLADLSQTAVVLADSPAAEDVSIYLTLMGRFGVSTGYPTTHVTVRKGQAGLALADKDIVLIASGNQAWLDPWATHMPAMLKSGDRRFEVSDMVYKDIRWRAPDPRDTESPARAKLDYRGSGAVAFIAGFESPVTAGRSVVIISGSEPAAQTLAADALLDDASSRNRFSGSLIVVHEKGVSPLVAEYSYSIGSLGFWRGLEWRFSKYWPQALSSWWLGLIALAILLLALLSVFRLIARKRQKA